MTDLDTPAPVLLQRYRDGDPASASHLFRRHLPRALEVVRARLAGNRQLRAVLDSQDLLQVACLKAFAALEDFECTSDAQFIGWFARIVENAASDEGRALHRDKRDIAREVHGEQVTEVIRGVASGVPSPSEVAMGEELAGRFFATVAEMPENYREAIVMRRLCKASYAEIAEVLELPGEDAARALLSRALAELSRRMDRGG
jgi:RNA polymerase sigma-70 factor (ECF subfamily)